MPKRLALIAGIIVTVLFHAAPSTAQTPDSDSLAAAKELITVLKLTDQIKTMAPIIMQGLKPAIVQNRPEVERAYDEVLPFVLELANRRLGEFVEAAAAIYARAFTASELREIAAFYQTPIGQKMLAKMPGLMQDSLAAGQRFGQSLAGELATRMKEELRKKGHNI